MTIQTRKVLGDKAGRHTSALEKSLLPEGFDYWAFISYSHKDEAVAKWLREELETYKVPQKLVGREVSYGKVPPRAYPVFRDRDEFRGASNLHKESEQALRASYYLVVVCSPNAAQSVWVNKEIATFKAMKREDRVLCLIIDGEPHAGEILGDESLECFPKAVRYRVDENGELTDERVEPIAADLRRGKDGKTNAKLKLLASILDVRYDELRQREYQRRFRRRIYFTLEAALLLLAVVASYLAAADAGFNLPGGERFRSFLDRHEISLLRSVHDIDEIKRAVSKLRLGYLENLKQRRAQTGGVLTNINPGATQWVDVWSYSQAVSAVLGVPEATEADKRSFVALLDVPFKQGVPVESGGRKYGWVGLEDKENTQAEPAFWTAIALIKAYGDSGLLDAEQKQKAIERLLYTQDVLKQHHPLQDNGWNKFIDQTNPSLHNTYATTLALMTLLEAKRAGLPWEGSIEQRDALIKAASGWLIEKYDARALVPGWHETGDSRYEIYEGLTLQIYAVLLRAEAEAGITIPDEILRQIPLHLSRLWGRDMSIPDQSGEFSTDMTDSRGQTYNATAADTFLVYPWAINCAARWLERTRKFPVPTEERVRVQRTLDYLTIQVGDEEVEKGRKSDWTYITAETLYALNDVYASE